VVTFILWYSEWWTTATYEVRENCGL